MIEEINLPERARIKLHNLRRRAAGCKATRDCDFQLIRECEARSQRLAHLIRAATDDKAATEYGAKLEATRDEHRRLVEVTVPP